MELSSVSDWLTSGSGWGLRFLFLGVAAADWLLGAFLFLGALSVPGASSSGTQAEGQNNISLTVLN